jgi:hypothetical protein
VIGLEGGRGPVLRRHRRRPVGADQPALEGLSVGLSGSGRTGIGGPAIQPGVLDDLSLDIAETPPLLLLPMRMEYRVLDRGAGLRGLDSSAERSGIAAARAAAEGSSARARVVRNEARRAAITAARSRAFTTDAVSLASEREIWFRWFPDEAFAEGGVETIREDESKLLADFQSAAGPVWWDLSDPGTSAAWQAFAAAVGPQRAVYLLRTQGAEGDEAWEARIGRIAALPSRVHLFAIKSGQVDSLGIGADIPSNVAAERSLVSYTYEALEPGGWFQDFSLAVEAGMGLRLQEQTAVETALTADGIIAVGTFSGAAEGEIETLLRDRIANGQFEILPQDAPTNNSPGQRSIHTDPRHDLNSFLAAATEEESGAFEDSSWKASELLAEALAIDPSVLRKAVHGADGGFDDARAMLRVVGPALLDDAVDGLTVLEGVDENQFIDALATAVVARGALPAVRFGNNAYGIAPITDVGAYMPAAGADEIEAKVHGFLARYAAIVRQFAPPHAERVVPVIEPGDPAASDKVAQILKTNRTSVRVNIAVEGSEKTSSLGCPYVAGATPSRRPATYLKNLRTKPLKVLPDPTEKDASWPLLYRLARLTLTRNTLLPVLQPHLEGKASLRALERLRTGGLPVVASEIALASGLSATSFATIRSTTFAGLDAARRRRLRTLNAEFAASLVRLAEIATRPNGTAELEALMLEVFDLFQHRVDAWAVGVAYARLRRNRQSGQGGLRAGYYGYLGKLRPESATGGGDGYIQAPSMAQATTAAVLRSAHLRHRADGAFAIDLRSSRMRRALRLLDLLKSGLSISEALGLRGERWLHDRRLSRLTLRLRQRLPIRNVAPPEGGDAGPSGRRVFDGLRFVKVGVSGFPAADRQHIDALRGALDDELDALTDLVMAEAVHQRALGAAESANAWLQVLAGDSVPGDPVFLRTLRTGQGSTHRVSLLIDEVEPEPEGSPREMAEPSLGALARLVLTGFDSSSAAVEVTRIDDPSLSTRVEVGLASDLRMNPLDLVVGGASELQVRIRHWLVTEWLTSSAFSTALGPPAGLGLDAFVAGKVAIDVDLSIGGQSVDTQLARAEALRRTIQGARALEPADLSAGADPTHPLTERAHIDLIAGAAAKLRNRCSLLEQSLAQAASTLSATRRSFILLVQSARGLIDAGASQAQLASALSQAESQRQALITTLRAAADFAEPAALRPFTLEEALARTTGLDERLAEIEGRLQSRRAGLASALSATADLTFTALSEARAALTMLSTALQGAVDGEALPILPPYTRTDATRPLLEPPVAPQHALADWSAVRRRVAEALAAANGVPNLQAHPVSRGATEDDAEGDDLDPRDESVAPRSYHHGVFLGTMAAVRTGASFVGVVCDEWAEQRPSEVQQTAMAVNYDSPQSEPPHCLLLCVPPNERFKLWSEERAARMVLEATRWMKARALSTDDKLTPAALLPNGNQVAPKKVGATSEPRIPRRHFRFPALSWAASEGVFMAVDAGTPSNPVGFVAGGGNERRGFYRVEE